MNVVTVEELSKSYGSIRAVDRVSFSVTRGEIFGLLGPNGAGKTTIVESLVGLRRPDAGRIAVFGVDPWHAPASWRERVGVQLQTTALFPRVNTEEVLRLFAAFYSRSQDPVALLEQVGLSDRRKARVRTLSGGEQQRLALALAMIHDPDLLLLDEVSTGLDPLGRRSMWDVLKDLRRRGKTIILTTHYMDEAEALCDRVLFVAKGRTVASGEPQGLITDRRVSNLDELYVALMGGGGR